ncbi:hypothetical protein nbrc107696_23540 [Gordonia spumicola]|uniref:Transmembrane protein n=1 Tax=Gordonia spumicola TaxID=589161 RepID=A0A7I9V940_9ACTN|nr:hypothetical protein [Gordonia spumicola]GEE01908.1 hypothetical protein nbrc107696_23540 [Gordonia spumicola]
MFDLKETLAYLAVTVVLFVGALLTSQPSWITWLLACVVGVQIVSGTARFVYIARRRRRTAN